MSKQTFIDVLKQEVARIDAAGVTKRSEIVIEGFTPQTESAAPKAILNGKEYAIFNSNDYLGFRFHPVVKTAEHEASHTFGTGPGAVRFISGSLSVHRELEQALAKFHGRDDAMVFSSAFATNLAVLFCLLKGQSRDSLVSGEVLVISDELNHRSIIDGIRVAGLKSEQKAIFKHMDAADLRRVLSENVGKWDRIVVVTDGIFSMLGEAQDLAGLQAVIDEFDTQFPQGIWLVVDDCHGVGAFGKTGRGCEEVSGVAADVLVGTLGKAFGADGGYVVGSQAMIDYLRESAATYIYSNSIAPGTAGAALAALQTLMSPDGTRMLKKLSENITWFKQAMIAAGFSFAVDSNHPIQPWFIGDTLKTKALKQALYERGFLVTNINFPVVPKGRDEIRVQMSASHTRQDLEAFVAAATDAGREVGLI
jgi:glycine C-acetyltransferase